MEISLNEGIRSALLTLCSWTLKKVRKELLCCVIFEGARHSWLHGGLNEERLSNKNAGELLTMKIKSGINHEQNIIL